MMAHGLAQISQLTDLRKLRLRREEQARQIASAEVTSAQRAHRSAIDAAASADHEYKIKVAQTYQRLNRGGISAMNMVGAMGDFNVFKQRVRDLDRVVDARQKDVDRADAALRESQERVRKAEMKVDVSTTFHREQKEAQNLMAEIIIEDETDELALLRKAPLGVCI
jgi:hypothetical protein